jgi:CheY-like chemotaxis protein
MSILVVDDSQVARLHLETLLRSAGFDDVRTAASAAEALAILGDHGARETGNAGAAEPVRDVTPVDLILMDVVMPEIDGVALCARLKRSSLADVPVIMVTALSDTARLAEAFAAGAMDYITKPANEVELLARVRSAVRLKQEIDQRKVREQEVSRQLQRALAAERALARANLLLADQAERLADLERLSSGPPLPHILSAQAFENPAEREYLPA